MDSSASLAEKAQRFMSLQILEGDDDFDLEELAARQRSRSFFGPRLSKKKPASIVEDSPGLETPKRTSSAPGVDSGNASSTKNTPAYVLIGGPRSNALSRAGEPRSDETVVPDSTRASARAVQRSEKTPMPTLKRLISDPRESPSHAVQPKRRKRGPEPVERPQEEQIFGHLSFFYIPDNDVAPARRIRINKAREFGATWTRVMSAATHVVVDRALQWNDVERMLAGADREHPPEVVNEDYPIDCIMFKAVLDPAQRKYQLTGQPPRQPGPPASEVPPSSVDTSKSLQLKPPQRNPRKWDYVPPKATPTRSEESTPGSRVAGTPIPQGSESSSVDAGPVVTSPTGIMRQPLPDLSSANTRNGRAAQTSGDQGSKGDELSEYIDMLQEYRDLPLDADDEDESKQTTDLARDSSGSDYSCSDEERKRSNRAKKSSRQKNLAFEERFACNTATSKDAASRHDNPNARTIEILQQMATYYDRIDDHWRTLGYRKAIATLKRQDVKITTEEEAFRLPAIGSRIAQKIEEIVTTDRLQRLEHAEAEPMSKSLQLFLQIYGVGNRQAQQWLAQGFRTLADLKAKARLSENQRVWVDHHDDLVRRIPKREVEALGSVVKRTASKIDPQVEIIIGGSYRRGANDSGDIDFIITKAATSTTADLIPFLNELVSRLEDASFLVARLAASRSGREGSKWHGCCILPPTDGINVDEAKGYVPVWRRVDFLLVPETEIGAALIYFTGNDIFNRSMRLLASKKGMRLNQRGLYKDTTRGAGREKPPEGDLLEGRDERRIFDLLGVRWRSPHERWC